MIVSSAPLRISLFGGGSDLPNFILNNGYGAVLSFSIESRVYTILHKLYKSSGYLLKYSKIEEVSDISEIQHPIVRRVFSKYEISGVELTVISDLPAGTGMGSSSAFTVSLLNSVHKYLHNSRDNLEIAKEACHIEINELNSPIGYQDQYASALGGFNLLKFEIIGEQPRTSILKNFNNNEITMEIMSKIILVEIGNARSANAILAKQSTQLMHGASNTSLQTNKMRELAMKYLDDAQFTYSNIVEDLNRSWNLKKSLISEISNSLVDNAFDLGIKLGADAGKLGGAGGSGFLIFLVPEEKHENFINEMAQRKLFCFRPVFSKEGLLDV